MSWPRTLFCRTTLVIASVSVAFQVFALGAIAYFALIPLGQRGADDFAARLVDMAGEWSRLPATDRAQLGTQAWQAHGVRLTAPDTPPAAFTKLLPYYYFLESALARRTGQPAELKRSFDATGTEWLWTNVATARGPILVGFSSERIGVYPPVALALILVVGTAATLLTSAWLARRLTASLRRLSAAACKVGSGDHPAALPEDGPEEVGNCVRSFNRMVSQVQELLAGRTTLLAGISHDLRTPLARLRLGLGMLSENHDPALAAQLMRDVDAMNELISRCLELGRGFEEPARNVDAGELLSEIVEEARRAGHTVEYAPAQWAVRLRPLAFRRVVANLLDNALRYGEGQPVAVQVEPATREVRILDRGPGIPEAEREAVFRPFHRLEPSRSASTGGSGLGLAIVRQLAQANGWRVGIEPRPGGGTTAVLQVVDDGRVETADAAQT